MYTRPVAVQVRVQVGVFRDDPFSRNPVPLAPVRCPSALRESRRRLFYSI